MMEPCNNLVQEYVKKHFTLSTRSYPYTRLSAEGLVISKTSKFHVDKRKHEQREKKENAAMGREDARSKKIESAAQKAEAAKKREEAAAARAAQKAAAAKEKAYAQAAKLARQPREKQVQALARKLANVSKLPEDKLEELIALISS